MIAETMTTPTTPTLPTPPTATDRTAAFSEAIDGGLAADSVVGRDHACIGCGYNLRGLAADTNCPECSLAIALSLRGDYLAFASAAYRKVLIRSLGLITNGMLVLIGLTIIWAGIGTMQATIASGWTSAALGLARALLLLVPYVMIALGLWMMVTPDVGYNGGNDPAIARRVTRVAVVAMVALNAGSSVMQALTPVFAAPGMTLTFWLVILVSWIASAAVLTLFFSTLVYLRWIAGRIPSPKWQRRARLYMWLLPVVCIVPMALLMVIGMGGLMVPSGGMAPSMTFWVVMGLVMIVTWLGALICYWNLMYYVRKEIRAIDAAAGSAGA